MRKAPVPCKLSQASSIPTCASTCLTRYMDKRCLKSLALKGFSLSVLDIFFNLLALGVRRA